MTNIDAQLVAWGIDPKYMSENEKIGKIYDKGFDNGLRFALDKMLEIISEEAEEFEQGYALDTSKYGFACATSLIREKVMALKEGE